MSLPLMCCQTECHWTVWFLFVTAHRCHCLTVAVQQEAGWAPGSVRTPWKREWNRRFSVISPWRSHCTDWPVSVYRTIKYCSKSCRSFCPGHFCPWALWSDCASVVGAVRTFLNLNDHVEAEPWLRPKTADFQDIQYNSLSQSFSRHTVRNVCTKAYSFFYIMRDFRLPPRRKWDHRSSGMLRILD